MGIFSSKIELSKKIRELEEELEQKKIDNNQLMHQVSDLKGKLEHIVKQNKDYEAKYIHTNLECEFCYNKLQEDYEYCPKCGKKIVKDKKGVCTETTASIFTTEPDGNYLLINQYTGFNDRKIVIPSSINDKQIIGIWNGVFEKCTALEEVYFEEGCRYIGKDVFKDCNKLKKVHLPKSLLEIGDSAFINCAIEEIALPPNVKVIGKYVFANGPLKQIVLPDTLKYISQGMLYNTSLEEVRIPQSVIHIGYSAFQNTKLKSVELPCNLYSIGGYAFEISSLNRMTIHSNVNVINDNMLGKYKPVICCAAGSKAQLFARKYGIECKEISVVQKVRIQTCASDIHVELNSWTKGESIVNWYPYFGISKSETWSWTSEVPNVLTIEKCMDMDDALQLKRTIQSFVNSHSDYSKPGINCSLQWLNINENW